jgi:glutathione S-transferase
MLLYNSVGPNPRVVRIFMAERGIELPRVEVDIRGGENRQAPYMAKNPTATCPALELDDGTIISEITAICEYLDETAPGASLIGSTPKERAETRMWARRIDLNILEPIANGFRFSDGLRMFQNRIHCIPAAAEDLKQLAQEKLAWLDGQIAGRQFVCGDRLSLADILLFAFLDFAESVRQPINPENKNIVAWHARFKARPSAAA